MSCQDKAELQLVSVIVVCYNETLEAISCTLESVFLQCYKNIEVIVIDGGSRSSTTTALERYLDKLTVFVSEPDNGIFDAMNKGISRASGAWLVFMNIGDSFFDETVISRVMKAMQLDSDIVYGNIFHNVVGPKNSLRVLNKYSLLLVGICHQAMFISRSCFETVGLYDVAEEIDGDPDWNIRAFLLGLSFQYIDLTIVRYDGRGVSSDVKLQLLSRNRLKARYLSSFELYRFLIFELCYKIAIRLCTGNFTMPVSWRRNSDA